MTLPVIQQPYGTYLDLDGTPLSGGKLFIGAVGLDPETNPQACYWDEAGTVPATQPIAIQSGFTTRLGAPARVYTTGPFSARVRDGFNVQVWYEADAGPLIDLVTLDAAKKDLTNVVQADVATKLKGIDVTDTGPNWPSYNTVYDTFAVNINGYPVTSRFGNNGVAITEALVGMVNVPANAAGGNACMGVSGYARTAGPGQGAVGIFGAALANGAGASCWGANTLTTNAAQCQAPTLTGKDTFTGWGIECDFNIKKLPGGAAPNMALRGIHFIGDSETGPSGGLNAKFDCIDVDSPGINMVPKLKWNNGLYTGDGCCSNALSIGTTAVGNGVGSQPILLRGRTAGGVANQASVQTDPDGNLAITAGAGASISLSNAGAVLAQVLPGGIVRAGGPFQVGVDQVVHQRHTGWGIPSGTVSTATFDTSTVTLVELAKRVAALIDALHGQAGGHGLLGT